MQDIKFKNRWYKWEQRIVTQISMDYIPDADLFWALRESVQNMVDEGVVSGCKYAWFKEDYGQAVFFYDGGSGVAFNDILYLGISHKRGVEGTVGRHGEGEVVSFAVAARLGVEKIMASQDWLAKGDVVEKDGYKLLAINLYRSDKSRKGTCWYYRGGYEVWDTFERALHSFRPPSVRSGGKRSKRQIINSEGGQLYTQGMRVNKVSGLALGYDLTSSPGRDRGGFTYDQVAHEIRDILGNATENDIEKIFREATWQWSQPKELELDTTIPSEVVQKAAKKICKHLSWSLLGHDGPETADALERGYKVIYVKETPPSWIKDNIPNVRQVVAGADVETNEKAPPNDVAESLLLLGKLIDFKGWDASCVWKFPDEKEIAQADLKRNIVVLSRQHLKAMSFRKFVETLAHELSHLMTKAADCTRQHESGTRTIMSGLLDKAVESPEVYMEAKKLFERYSGV